METWKRLFMKKPRMMNANYENLKIIYNRSKLGWYWAPLYAVAWFLLFYLVVLNTFYYYPELLKIQDELTVPGSFIGERAEQFLLKLSKIGPKVTGSPSNEQTTLYLLLNEIGSIKQEARKDLYNIDHEVQVASGNYAKWEASVIAYQSIQNVIVKVTPRNVTTDVSLLVNSHFDTGPSSPGAGDAGFMIAIMLEALRVITKFETPMNCSIIFLFNGAEEIMMRGSHAFITKHKWAKNIGAVINLDSAGSGGHELLFRAGPAPWLLKIYGSSVIHPSAMTLAEEAFESELIPFDTDFPVFQTHGNLSGLDLVSILNGYVYHTKNDRFSAIPRGSYQSTGDNVLALLKAMAISPELHNFQNRSQEKMIFFDVLGLFFISYTETTGLLLNIVVCILAVLTILVYIWNMANQTGMFRRRIFAKFSILFGIQFCAVILAIGVTIFIAFFIDICGLSLSWYTNKWMIFGLYFCPTFFVLGILPAIYLGKVKEHGLPLGYAIQLIMHSHCLILCVILIVSTSLHIRSAFLIMISIAFYTVSVILNILMCFHNKTFLWLIPHLTCQILPFLFYTFWVYTFYVVFIPIAGRSGAESNPELIIAGLMCLLSPLFVAFLIPIFWLFRKSKLIISTFGIICVIFIILAATPLGFPFSENELAQRYVVEHTVRTFHNADPQMSVNYSDSGYFIVRFDRRTISFDFLTNEKFIVTEASCEMKAPCGYPKTSQKTPPSASNFWAQGPPPQLDGWPTTTIVAKESTSAKNVLYTIEISGPDHMTILIQPVNNAKLVYWSFDQEVITENQNEIYTIYFTYAIDPAPWRFNLEFEHEFSNWSGPAFELVVTGSKLHHDIFHTDDFREFLARFPSWTAPIAWLSSYDVWIL